MKHAEIDKDALFLNPTSEYRGAPFWAWNCQMTPEKIDMLVDALHDMGMGGGHIHCRTGMNNPYMSREFLDLVKHAHNRFLEHGMITRLYDEDRWPSGTAGGFVTKDEKYRARFMVFTPRKLEDGIRNKHFAADGSAVRSDSRVLLARYQVSLEEGWLKDYRQLTEDEQPEKNYTEWYAYLEISGNNPWFNNQAYVNTLDKKAIERFVELTHEVYKREFGDEFGKTIPSIFTDEPQFPHKTRLNYASDQMDVIIPYTDDLEETFKEAYGHSLLASLPELFWERKEEMVSQIRYQYHDHICERFASAYADTIGDWCEKNNLMLTGHMMEEPTLKSQSAALGEAMRSYRSFQLPGIDIVSDRREYSTAKQAQSASHQYGRKGVMSELYGVTKWDFDFRGHKLQGDWQAALGITTRVPHLTWTSMAGEAKRDYPASIGYQSPWYKEYRYVEDYFARVNTLLTRGKPEVKIGVIHPIESYWLYWGSEEKTGGIREEMDNNFQNLIRWMLYGLLDFDFISESLLPGLNHIGESTPEKFHVGAMDYDAVLVPNCTTMRRSTLERLKEWKALGGEVIFAGEIPSYVDALPSKEVEEFATQCKCVLFTKNSLLNVLEEKRSVEVRDEAGLMSDNLFYQMRSDGENRILFLAHGKKMKNPDMPVRKQLTVSIQGTYEVLCYHPLDGTKETLTSLHKNGKTIIKRELYDHDSLLLYLLPTQCEMSEEQEDDITITENQTVELMVPHVVPVALSEPNVLVLDQAEYSFDHGGWMPREEILRIDNKFREILNYPLRMEAFAQPWLDQTQETPQHTLTLRYMIESEIELDDVILALENREAIVTLNGTRVVKEECGWYTDKAIICRKLGHLNRGQNELIVEIPYGRKENIENMLVLGEFGVKVFGSECILTEPVRTMAFGDQTTQGLPFYGGNVEYYLPITMPEDGILSMQISRYRNPLLKVSLDEGEEQVLAYAPYQVKMECAKGEHVLRIKAFGNRVNTFGTIHNCDDTFDWFGPNAWRTEDNAWSYEYQLKPTGILKTPVVKCQKYRD